MSAKHPCSTAYHRVISTTTGHVIIFAIIQHYRIFFSTSSGKVYADVRLKKYVYFISSQGRSKLQITAVTVNLHFSPLPSGGPSSPKKNRKNLFKMFPQNATIVFIQTTMDMDDSLYLSTQHSRNFYVFSSAPRTSRVYELLVFCGVPRSWVFRCSCF